MKLNQRQRYALLDWLSKNIVNFVDMQIIYSFDEFCDGNITEWRVIPTFGMAGKLWNNNDKIYISGYSGGEIGGFDSDTYKKQQERIDKWNAEIAELIGIYDDAFDEPKYCARCKDEEDAPSYCNCGYGFCNLEGRT